MSEKKILVVDDDAQVRELLEKALNRAGYTVRLANSAEAALKIIAKEQFSVMFIDLGLEPMNGFELCEKIRETDTDAIIFALSGYAQLFGPQEILEAGFNDYFAKPIELQTIYDGLQESFEKLAEQDAKKAIERIMIVDDDDQFRHILRKMLEQEGYKITEAASGEEGLKRFSETPVDLVITDIIMPGKEGLETMVEILEADPSVKFIVVSGSSWYGAEAEFEMARSLGARTLKKPFKLKEILDIIKQM